MQRTQDNELKILSNLSGERPTRELELKTPEDLVDDWIQAAEGDIERPLTTCMAKIDSDLRGKLRGTVGAYIGKGGTKKSLLALQACRTNVLQHKNNCTGIYSNMEMGIFQFMSRVMDMSIRPNEYTDYNSSLWYDVEFIRAYREEDKEKSKEMKEAIRKELKEKFKDLYGKNLYVNSQSGMTIDDFHKLVKKAKERNGTVDMLVIDGLSMMSGVGTETESYTANSKELKDLAKLHNIYIPLICHLTKGPEKHTRDTQSFIRGSEKILDNVDFVIMMSLIIDGAWSDENNIVYYDRKGYIRFFNKRGSGKTINIIYEFDPRTLTMTQTEDDPNSCEVDLKKKMKKDFF